MRSPAGEESGPFGFDHCRPESQQATDMSPEEEVVYDFVTDLTTKHCRVGGVFDRAKKLLGEQQVVDLIGVAGTYVGVAMLLAMAEQGMPADYAGAGAARRARRPSPANPTSSIAQVESSGTAIVLASPPSKTVRTTTQLLHSKEPEPTAGGGRSGLTPPLTSGLAKSN
jgi:hypothetical protein